MSSLDGHAWAWDMFPLGDHAWPNTRVATDSPSGYEMLLWGAGKTPGEVEVLPHTGSGVAAQQASERAQKGESLRRPRVRRIYRRRGYRPGAEELTILQRVFPNAAPDNPSWVAVEAKLVAGGYSPSELKGMTAPLLVQLLGHLFQPAVSEEKPPVVGEEEAGRGSDDWITRDKAASIIGIAPASVGRLAGPQDSNKPILDNGVKQHGRRFWKSSVVEYAANRNRRARAAIARDESVAEVERKMRDVGI